MSLAFVACIFEAVLVFSPHSSLLGSVTHQTKVTVHWMVAVLGAACAVGGFGVIFLVGQNSDFTYNIIKKIYERGCLW
jgi:hypothetical protein